MLENKEEIIKVLENDGVIAYVTDTVWGLGCLPSSEKAVKKIYEIKKTRSTKTFNSYVKRNIPPVGIHKTDT